MSKNKNYGSYYKNPLVEQPAEEVEEPVTETQASEPTVIETEVTPTEVVQKTAAIVKGAARVNMRAQASKDAHVLLVIPENTAVKILDDSNKYWFRIEANGKVGFMMSKFLKRV